MSHNFNMVIQSDDKSVHLNELRTIKKRRMILFKEQLYSDKIN